MAFARLGLVLSDTLTHGFLCYSLQKKLISMTNEQNSRLATSLIKHIHNFLSNPVEGQTKRQRTNKPKNNSCINNNNVSNNVWPSSEVRQWWWRWSLWPKCDQSTRVSAGWDTSSTTVSTSEPLPTSYVALASVASLYTHVSCQQQQHAKNNVDMTSLDYTFVQ